MYDRRSMRSSTEINTALPLASAVVCLTYNALTVVLCNHLPHDPSRLASFIHLYSLVGCVLSTVGIYGVTTKRPALVRTFAQFMLVDAFISVICRMLLEEFFVETLYETNVCGSTFDDEHWSSLNTGYAIATSARMESKFKRLFNSSESCSVALAGLHFVAIGAMILTSAAQVALAVVMQKFGKQLEAMNRYRLWTIAEVDEKCLEEEEYSGAILEKQ